jgi:hypothetical protein
MMRNSYTLQSKVATRFLGFFLDTLLSWLPTNGRVC